MFFSVARQKLAEASWGRRAAEVENDNMPVRDYEPFFDPNQVARMTTAFDSAWQKPSRGAAKNQQEIQTLRTKLAECVVMSALEISEKGPEE
jgi:hypothetical protein